MARVNRRVVVVEHPGRVLQRLLARRGISQTRLATHTGDSAPKISEIVQGKRGISPLEAWRLARALDGTPHFWMGLQVDWELAQTEALERNIGPIDDGPTMERRGCPPALRSVEPADPASGD